MNAQDIIQEYKLVYGPNGDKWGESIGLLFDICHELYSRGEDVPAECGYSPGAAIDPRRV